MNNIIKILLNSDNEIDALNQIEEDIAKGNILEAMDDLDIGISIES